ncbi:pollen-specific leucine-rich repeat extensin-like protein 1 [Sorghum bicolor]|uniref:pollen-specific leucine-rich repeat extensin-like protein 1 n=1 Tax=Sorghum bicolor TaxID=4558 RepID=UPI000B4262D2|nr:pollen-specific leucine-rich repeat extensin-like protein 1 [Sorghum bicolor]|eukprot:XP_021305509.1 pollen-specific leucine-rich repeat extensin-like protein 1 [Sorghum bicolor]
MTDAIAPITWQGKATTVSTTLSTAAGQGGTHLSSPSSVRIGREQQPPPPLRIPRPANKPKFTAPYKKRRNSPARTPRRPSRETLALSALIAKLAPLPLKSAPPPSSFSLPSTFHESEAVIVFASSCRPRRCPWLASPHPEPPPRRAPGGANGATAARRPPLRSAPVRGPPWTAALRPRAAGPLDRVQEAATAAPQARSTMDRGLPLPRAPVYSIVLWTGHSPAATWPAKLMTRHLTCRKSVIRFRPVQAVEFSLTGRVDNIVFQPNQHLDDVENDEDKQDHFLEGLNDGLSYMMSNVKYASFQEMVDRALVLES